MPPIVTPTVPERTGPALPRSEIRHARDAVNMKWVEPAGLVKFDFLGLRR